MSSGGWGYGASGRGAQRGRAWEGEDEAPARQPGRRGSPGGGRDPRESRDARAPRDGRDPREPRDYRDPRAGRGPAGGSSGRWEHDPGTSRAGPRGGRIPPGRDLDADDWGAGNRSGERRVDRGPNSRARADQWSGSGGGRNGARDPERSGPSGGRRPPSRADEWGATPRGGGLWADENEAPSRSRRAGPSASMDRGRRPAGRGALWDEVDAPPMRDRRGRQADSRERSTRDGPRGARRPMRPDDPWSALDSDEDEEGSRGKGLLSALGIILLGLVLGGASGYAYWHFTAPKVEATSSPSTSSATPTATSSGTPNATATGTPHAFAAQHVPEVWVEMPGAL